MLLSRPAGPDQANTMAALWPCRYFSLLVSSFARAMSFSKMCIRDRDEVNAKAAELGIKAK